MHKKHIEEKDKIVELKELVSQPECLKLLILHTPFLLNISTLHECVNLVKLDLSKNNLASFPYLGDLPNLKFMFIHENKLDIDSLVGIFEYREGEGLKNSPREGRSALSRSIVWVTYWGNKNQFNARHYLINNTSALAIDRNMVVLEERNQSIILNPKFEQPFGPNTDVSEILQNRKKFNKNATQEEYMTEFWADMAEIRKKQIKINPVIYIQKVFRGWIYRAKQIRKKQEKENNISLVKSSFLAWKRISSYQKKLRKIMTKQNKQYLLYPIKQMRLEQAKRKILDFVREAKRKHILRKMNLRAQYKFFNVLKSNQQALRSLYNVLHIDQSNYIMVHIEGLELFKKFVIPVASSMNQGHQVLIEKNTNIYLRQLYITPRKRRQFLRLLQLNEKSLVFQQKLNKNKKIINFNYTVYKVDTGLRKLYSQDNIHFSVNQKNKMKGIDKSIQKKKIMELSELLKISGNGNKQLLRDIVRGVYFYNMGYLTNCVVPVQKINILSEYSIKRVTAILRIQRMWRGANLRKKIMKIARKNYLNTRAAAKIQRWYRNLSINHRKNFMLQTSRTLRSFTNQYFYVKLDEYINLVSNENQRESSDNSMLTFLEQNIKIFIANQSRKLVISWDTESENKNVQTCHQINKPLFTKEYRNKIFDNQNLLLSVSPKQRQNYQECSISHLFHYRTQVSILNRKNSQYLQVKCSSKYDCRLRVLAIFLLTYKFDHKYHMSVLPKEYVNLYQIEHSLKKPIKNNESVFISQSSSQFEIEPMNSQNSNIYNLESKFYVNQTNQKPIKFATQLKIILIESQHIEQEKVPQRTSPKKKLRAMSYNQKFDISNFLIAETNQIKLDYSIHEGVSNQNGPKLKKDSLKNIKVEKKTKVRGRDKLLSAHLEGKDGHNFMLGDPRSLERLTTQPDMLTNERSLGSIVVQPQHPIKKQNFHKNAIKNVQSRVLMRKRLAINNEDKKSNFKQMEQFTKNFINQGNFIQSQFLYGQIKRLKTQIQKKSNDSVTRVKTEQSEGHKYLNRFKEDKLKRAHLGEQKHRQELYKSVIQKKADLQSKIQRKSEARQSANYKSLPRKMRINFAQECYPIIGKHPHHRQMNNRATQ